MTAPYVGWSPEFLDVSAVRVRVGSNVNAGTLNAPITYTEQLQLLQGSVLNEITCGTNLLFSSTNSRINGLSQIEMNSGSATRQINNVQFIRNAGMDTPLNILIGGGGTETLNFMTNGDAIRATMSATGTFSFSELPTCATLATSNAQFANKQYVDGRVTFKPTREFYVSKQGLDTNNGSALAPFLTIQAAINAAEAIPPTSSGMVIINVLAGVYTEDLTHSVGYVNVRGGLANLVPTGTTIIDGTISIALGGSDDLFGKQISYSGLQINKQITDTSTAQHSISFTDCYLYSTTRNLNQNSSADNRTYISNSYIQQVGGNGPQIEIQNGQLKVERCSIYTDGNFNQISIAGSSVGTRIAFNDIQNSSAANALNATIVITSSTTTPHNIGGNSFVWTTLGSPPYRATTPNASGILFSTGAVNPTAITSQNLFALLGTTDSGGANHAIMTDAAMTGVPSIVNAGNYGFLGTTKVLNSITQISSSLIT